MQDYLRMYAGLVLEQQKAELQQRVRSRLILVLSKWRRSMMDRLRIRPRLPADVDGMEDGSVHDLDATRRRCAVVTVDALQPLRRVLRYCC